jgi:FkbM family methyltransferase
MQLKRVLRRFYDVYLSRNPRRLAFYNYMDAGGEQLRVKYPLGEDSIVIDAGGYLGDFADEITARFNCRIDVFEPVEQYYRKISERFEANEKVSVIHAGLGAEDRVDRINVEGLASSVFGSRDTSDHGEKIQIISLVDYLNSKQYPVVDLVKINVEGGEYEMLNSLLACPELVNGIRYFQIQFHDFVPEAQTLRNEIRSKLARTHKLMWDFSFIWESWERIDND